MPNHVACERRKGGEHWRVLSTFAESAESGVVTRMPNQELGHHTALCKSGINSCHGHGEESAFAQLFCGMLRPDVLYAVMKATPISKTAPLYRDSLWLSRRSPDSAHVDWRMAHGACRVAHGRGPNGAWTRPRAHGAWRITRDTYGLGFRV